MVNHHVKAKEFSLVVVCRCLHHIGQRSRAKTKYLVCVRNRGPLPHRPLQGRFKKGVKGSMPAMV